MPTVADTPPGVEPVPDLELARLADGWVETSWDERFNGWALETGSAPTEEAFAILERVPLFIDGRYRHRLAPTTREFFQLVESDPYVFDIPCDPGAHKLAMIDQDHVRVYRLYVPAAYPDSPPAGGSPTGNHPVPRTGRCPGGFPLIVLNPGTGQSADTFASAHPDLLEDCNTEGFLLVITQAAGDLNQGGKLVWNNLPDPERPDDIAFTKTLIRQLQDKFWIDENRIYSAGFSGGAQNGYLLAATTVDLVAAVANIGTSIGSSKLDPEVIDYPPQPLAPLPFFIVSSKLDEKRPYYGGPNINGTLLTAAAEAPQFWLEINGLSDPSTVESGFPAEPQQIVLAHQCAGPLAPDMDIEVEIGPGENSVTTEAWGDGSEFEVLFTTLELACHQWTDDGDNVNFDMNAASLEFFKRHRRRPDADPVGPDPVVPNAAWTQTSFAGFDTIYHVPAVPRGLVCVFHGTGGDASFATEVEMVEILNQLTADDFAFVATSSTDRAAGAQWDITQEFDGADPGAGNPDVARMLALRQSLVAGTAIGDNTPLLPLGFSNGARFAAVFAKEAREEGLSVGATALLHPNAATHLTPLVEEAFAELDRLTFIATGENDTVDPDATGALYLDVWDRHIRSGSFEPPPVFFLGKEKAFAPGRFGRLGMAPAEIGALGSFLEASGLIETAGGERVFCTDEIATVGATLDVPPPLDPWEDEIRRQLRTLWASHYPDATCKVPLADFFLASACADVSPPAPVPASAAELAADPGPFPVVQRLVWDNPVGFQFDGFDTLYRIPENPCGLCFVMHGTGGGTGFTGGLDMRDFIHGLLGQGIAVVATESTDRDNNKVPGARWDTEVILADGSSNLAANPDWLRLMALRDWLLDNSDLTAPMPLYFLGFSNGADASLCYAVAARESGLNVGGIGMLAAGVCSAPVRRAAQQLTGVPVFINVLESDHRRWMNEMLRDELVARGVTVEFRLGLEKALNPLRFTRIPSHSDPPPAAPAEYDATEAGLIFDELVARGMIDQDGARLLEVADYEAAAAGLPDGDLTRQAKVANAAGHTISSEFRDVLLDLFAAAKVPML